MAENWNKLFTHIKDPAGVVGWEGLILYTLKAHVQPSSFVHPVLQENDSA